MKKYNEGEIFTTRKGLVVYTRIGLVYGVSVRSARDLAIYVARVNRGCFITNCSLENNIPFDVRADATSANALAGIELLPGYLARVDVDRKDDVSWMMARRISDGLSARREHFIV